MLYFGEKVAILLIKVVRKGGQREDMSSLSKKQSKELGKLSNKAKKKLGLKVVSVKVK